MNVETEPNIQPDRSDFSDHSVPVTVVDADVHVAPRTDEEIIDYLPDALRSNGLGRDGSMYFAPSGGMRVDARPNVGPPGSDPDVLHRQLFQDAGIDFDVLLPLVTGHFPDPMVDAAMKAASNLWLSDTWLGRYNPHGRHKGSIWVSVENPNAAVEEIERWAGHPHFVQVLVGHHPKSLYGQPQYHPIWEAAARHGLPVAVHVDSSGYPPVPTTVGFFSQYFEHHSVGHPLVYAAHLTSLICEGVFDKFPELHFV
jgi:predicted TIM-barrel fold metal-dependent hydrolase